MGIRKMMGRKMCKDMHKEVRLEVDGKLVELPPVEGIIILNILRYSANCDHKLFAKLTFSFQQLGLGGESLGIRAG